QKCLASSGVGSRRKCEEYIKQGRVQVNNIVIKELGTKIDSDIDQIKFDGQRIKQERKYYFALNKPKGFICSTQDSFGRKKTTDIFNNISARLYTVGRLDLNSEGLIFVTNDGDFSNAVLHPRKKINKTYLIVIDEELSEKQLNKIEKGVWFDGAKSLPAKVQKPIIRIGQKYQVKITIYEGRNRQLRKMFEILGHKVRKLTRVNIGCIKLGKLKTGEYRNLSDEEIECFMKGSG
ncbi:pseudouridine synthase, partial [Chlamydiota bacterium]